MKGQEAKQERKEEAREKDVRKTKQIRNDNEKQQQRRKNDKQTR